MLARFESREAAQRNSDRPEQDAWWSEVSKGFAGEVTFIDGEDVVIDMVGDPDSAGFVQVMSGRATDPRRAREIMDATSGSVRDYRPDILGTLTIRQDDGGFTMAAYFRDEASAREGEQKEPPAAVRSLMDQQAALMSDLSYIDLREPWLFSPR
ncbi:MAG: hypothetical protein ACXV2H_14820 [Actinomycetes bacterium]